MQKNKRIQTICHVAMFASLLVLGAWISLPFPIPITLQTFVLFVMIGTLAPLISLAACAVYLGLGIVGLPVFSGFQAGIGVLLGPTGGFLLGFLPTVLLSGCICHKSTSLVCRYFAALLGMIMIYLCGATWYTFVYGKSTAFSVCILPFLLPDAIKILLAVPLSLRLRRILT